MCVCSVFILLSGRASVYVLSTFTFEELNDNVDTSDQPYSTDSPDLETHELDRTRFGRFAMSYVAGQSFGELALLGDDNKHRRNASVIADDDTDLLVIERDLLGAEKQDDVVYL
ncbi:hypothetical protein NP493_188g03029 [Ridgeia piscesae]|uniref:Cyclic nucleotide-binding domain-containing protein n=1 Tax=Ridgeia piscesae TaxID=27915 RepID=A0AAD9P290_RIDPI|nr:hypothetical protein NP493_188g03029 [Ridgeia piscesae]